MTIFRYALATHGRTVRFFRHGDAEPYHTSKALMGPIGSGTSVGEMTARGAASPSRRVLWFPAGETFPKPTDGYIEVDGVALLVERADSPTVADACRVVVRERDADRNFGAPKDGATTGDIGSTFDAASAAADGSFSEEVRV